MMHDELNDEQIVKEAIKEVLHDGMIFIPCVSCGETWFIPSDHLNALEKSFICVKCLIQKQRGGE